MPLLYTPPPLLPFSTNTDSTPDLSRQPYLSISLPHAPLSLYLSSPQPNLTYLFRPVPPCPSPLPISLLNELLETVASLTGAIPLDWACCDDGEG